MDKFSEIQAFIKVADARSFTIAAEQLNLSRSRVSQLIARLENRIGVTLMHRTTRSLTLTPEGEQFRTSCRAGMQQLENAESNLKLMSTRLSGPVRMNSVGGIIGEQILATALSEVVNDHPELTIHIEFSSDQVDVNKDPIDLVLRVGKQPGPQVNYSHLAVINHTLCASPRFLNEFGFPQQPLDLEETQCVCGTPKTWDLVKGKERISISPKTLWRSPSSQAQLIAVEQSLGICRLLSILAKHPLKEGKLVQVLPEWQIEPTDLWLIWSNKGELPKRIEMVKDHLINRLSLITNRMGS